MKHMCEVCNKSFAKDEETLACERERKAEREHKELLYAEKEKRFTEIKRKERGKLNGNV